MSAIVEDGAQALDGITTAAGKASEALFGARRTSVNGQYITFYDTEDC